MFAARFEIRSGNAEDIREAQRLYGSGDHWHRVLWYV